MGKRFHYFLLFFILISAQCFAQDTVNVTEVDTTTGTQYQPKHYFDSITAIQTVDERKIADTTISKLRADDDYWYVNLTPEKKEPVKNEPRKSIFQTSWFNTLFWIFLIGIFLALIIWFLSTSNISLFRKSSKKIEQAQTEEELTTENIFELNYEQEIKKAIAAQNYRLAVRLFYLRTLKELSERNLINYTHEKTNSDYLFQLSGTNYYKDFFRLTRSFDYTWYGKFPLSPEQFEQMQNDFQKFKQQLR